MLWKSFVFTLCTFSTTVAFSGDPPVIKPDEAASNVDKEVIVEYTVNSARLLDDKNVAFLNSESNNRDDKNFTAFITSKCLRAFKDERKIANPAAEYVSKKIRVKGMVKLHKSKPEIEVDRPDQIELVQEQTEPNARS